MKKIFCIIQLLLVFFCFSCKPKLQNDNTNSIVRIDTNIYYYVQGDTFLISYIKVTDSINNILNPPIRIGTWKYFYPNYKLKQTDQYNSFGTLTHRIKLYESGNIQYDFVLNKEDTSYIHKYSVNGKITYYEKFFSTQQVDNYGTLRIKKYYSDKGLLLKEIIDSIDNTIEIKYYPNGQKSSYREITYYDDYNGKVIEWDSLGNLILETNIKSDYIIYY